MATSEALNLLLSGFFFVFGSLIGSFSNVVILRMASGKSVIFPPSACPKCDHQLHAIDLIPVFSWLFLRGRCRYCQVPIAWQYPVVEACISLIIGFSFIKAGPSVTFIALAGRSVIWFVASVLFVRNEVQSPNPFAWAAIFFAYLNFPGGCCPFIDRRTLIIPFISAVAVGSIAGLRNAKANNFAWGCLSFIFVFSMMPRFSTLVALPLLLAAVLNCFDRTSRAANLLFFGLQVAAIAVAVGPF
ncbi:MAG: prepilin peptidase [Candidatus Riflebacteria bacterium]|nr:prepilin peptidase [Candidatus Riflebacteria bacterium]